MLLMDERRDQILEQLISHGSVHVGDLAQQFSVSYETIRKDLAFLADRGYLIKSHGGATIKQNAIEHSFGIRERENVNAKSAIAQAAFALVPEGSSVIVGSGSTMVQLAKLLSLRSGLKLFTDSLPVATVLIQSDNQVFLFGGELRDQSSSVFGGWTVSQIRQIQADLCFIGTDGFVNLNGPTSPSSSDAFIDREILDHADKSFVLADYSKFKRKSLYQICDWTEIDTLITNRAADSSAVERILRQTKVLLADPMK